MSKHDLDNQRAAAKSHKKSENDLQYADFARLKKKELLEIMLRQGEEIDSLRAKIAELEKQLYSREIKIGKAGSIAEASLALTSVFEEAQKAANLYLENVKKAIDAKAAVDTYYGGADSDE